MISCPTSALKCLAIRSRSGSATRVYDWQRIAALIQSGAFPVERVITSKIKLEATVPQGIEALIDPAGSQLKILVGVNWA